LQDGGSHVIGVEDIVHVAETNFGVEEFYFIPFLLVVFPINGFELTVTNRTLLFLLLEMNAPNQAFKQDSFI
jgi:hypothetical protein